LRTREHGRRGLARPAQNSAQLLAPHNTFASAEERRSAQSESNSDIGSGAEGGR